MVEAVTQAINGNLAAIRAKLVPAYARPEWRGSLLAARKAAGWRDRTRQLFPYAKPLKHSQRVPAAIVEVDHLDAGTQRTQQPTPF